MTRKIWCTSLCITLLCLLFASKPFVAYATTESIRSFAVTMQLMTDARLQVTEDILINISDYGTIKHGIIRYIPIPQKPLPSGHWQSITQVSVQHNDKKSSPMQTEYIDGALIIRTGEKHLTLKAGLHRFVISYTVQNGILYNKDHEILLWNITGNDWRMPIENASFKLILPGVHPVSMKEAAAYTGALGATEQNYTATANNTFATTKTLLPGEGFTVAIALPVGTSFPPKLSLAQKCSAFFFLYDHIFTFLICAFSMVLVWMVIRRARPAEAFDAGRVVPSWHPPRNMDPAAIRNAAFFTYDNTSLASMILYLAVNHQLRIKDDYSTLSLVRTPTGNKETDAKLPTAARRLLATLFPEKITELVINKANSYRLYRAYYAIRVQQSPKKFRTRKYLYFFTLLPLLALISFNMTNIHTPNLDLPIMLVTLISLGTILYQYAYSYSKFWIELAQEIQGFHLYLSTAETERLSLLYPAVRNDFPAKTPETFERFLPYALALDLTESWANSFALELQASNYQCHWIESVGSMDHTFDSIILIDIQIQLFHMLDTIVVSKLANHTNNLDELLNYGDNNILAGLAKLGGAGGGHGSSGGGFGGGGGRGW